MAPWRRIISAPRWSTSERLRACIEVIVRLRSEISASRARPQLGQPFPVSAVAPQFEHGYVAKASPPVRFYPEECRLSVFSR